MGTPRGLVPNEFQREKKMKKLKKNRRIQTFEKSQKNQEKSRKLIKNEIFFEKEFLDFFDFFLHFPLKLYRSRGAGSYRVQMEKNRENRKIEIFLKKKIKKNTMKSRTSKHVGKKKQPEKS